MSHLISSIPTTTATIDVNSGTYIPSCSALSVHEKATSVDRQEATALFQIFRQEMSPLFPFVVIPPNLTEWQLLQEKPMLHMAIMAVACQSNLDLQVALTRKFREEISRAIFVSGEKNLGMLQGTLVFLAWSVAQ